MKTSLILKNLDSGNITQDGAIELMLKHTARAYAIGAYLDSHRECKKLRKQLYALQGETPRPVMDGNVIVDLIDHAFLTGHYGQNRAHAHLCDIGMDAEKADHHLVTLGVIRGHDLERKNYLDFPEHAPRYCTRCGRMVKAGELSNRGNCAECWTAAIEENLTALDTKTGPAYRRWRGAMLKWVYALENEEIAEQRVSDTPELDDLSNPFSPLPANIAKRLSMNLGDLGNTTEADAE